MRHVAIVLEKAVARRSAREALEGVAEVKVVAMPPTLATLSQAAAQTVDALVVSGDLADVEMVNGQAKSRPELDIVVIGGPPRSPAGSPKNVRRIRFDGKPADIGEVVLHSLVEKKRIARPPTVAGRAGSRGRRDLVVIGCSTGGPKALTTVVDALPANFPLPILVTQHMPPNFTGGLAKTINASSQLTVNEALEPALPKAGEVWIAPGDRHLVIADASGRFDHSFEPPVNSCRPSVDVMFESVERYVSGRVIVVMLTGMGHDGRDGTARLQAAGAHVIAQDKETSVVWGMPGAVVEAGLADQVLPLDSIAGAIVAQAGVGNASPSNTRTAQGAT